MALGVSVADYDNDGDDDLFLTTIYKNILFTNDRGYFVEAKNAGLNKESAWSTSAVFFDADRDGWVDLYVGNYVDWSPAKDLTCMYNDRKVFLYTPGVHRARELLLSK